ncbi:unnamed protein product [Prunus armeniaca]
MAALDSVLGPVVVVVQYALALALIQHSSKNPSKNRNGSRLLFSLRICFSSLFMMRLGLQNVFDKSRTNYRVIRYHHVSW